MSSKSKDHPRLRRISSTRHRSVIMTFTGIYKNNVKPEELEDTLKEKLANHVKAWMREITAHTDRNETVELRLNGSHLLGIYTAKETDANYNRRVQAYEKSKAEREKLKEVRAEAKKDRAVAKKQKLIADAEKFGFKLIPLEETSTPLYRE